MNLLGILPAIAAGLEAVGHVLGRKRKQESRRELIWFGVVYIVLILLGIGLIALTVRRLYFE